VCKFYADRSSASGLTIVGSTGVNTNNQEKYIQIYTSPQLSKIGFAYYASNGKPKF
jgi:hypothetical protein